MHFLMVGAALVWVPVFQVLRKFKKYSCWPSCEFVMKKMLVVLQKLEILYIFIDSPFYPTFAFAFIGAGLKKTFFKGVKVFRIFIWVLTVHTTFVRIRLDDYIFKDRSKIKLGITINLIPKYDTLLKKAVQSFNCHLIPHYSSIWINLTI